MESCNNAKTKYRVANWTSYDRVLVHRGDVTLWVSPAAVATWTPAGVGTRGGQRKYSDLAIETALTLRLLFHLPLRQTEGFLTSLFGMMGLGLSAPDHTTLSRRGQSLDLTLHRVPPNDRMHLIVDSTGLSIVGEGEWAAAKHGRRGRQAWKRLHLGVNRSGVIIAQALTDATVDDATIGITLIEELDGALASVTGDAAYDTIAFYDAAAARGTRVVVPPTKTAKVSRRDRGRALEIGRSRTWRNSDDADGKKDSGYHRQARVENAFFRYKSIIGGGLRAQTPGGQLAESLLACRVLNRMSELGRSESYSIGR